MWKKILLVKTQALNYVRCIEDIASTGIMYECKENDILFWFEEDSHQIIYSKSFEKLDDLDLDSDLPEAFFLVQEKIY